MTDAPHDFDAWLNEGRGLVARRTEADWRIAEWMARGKTAGQLKGQKIDGIGDRIGIAGKRLKDALRAVLAFPSAVRDMTLTVEHHAAVANLPSDEAATLLRRASAEQLQAKVLREAATQHRYATGKNFKDEDADSSLCTVVLRAWNRATPDAREMAFEQMKIAAANGLSIVDEDEAPDAYR
jgi:citrate synthase